MKSYTWKLRISDYFELFQGELNWCKMNELIWVLCIIVIQVILNFYEENSDNQVWKKQKNNDEVKRVKVQPPCQINLCPNLVIENLCTKTTTVINWFIFSIVTVSCVWCVCVWKSLNLFLKYWKSKITFDF